MLADFMTLKEKLGHLEGLSLVYIGNGRNNVANSLLVTSAILGVNITIIAPPALQPSQDTIALAQGLVKESSITITDQVDAVKGDAIYTDVWVSMGEDTDFEERIQLLLPYQVNEELLAKTENAEVLVLHCLPAFHDTKTSIGKAIFEKYQLDALEITDAVFQKHSHVIFQEAENRLHTIKAMLFASLHNPDQLFPELESLA